MALVMGMDQESLAVALHSRGTQSIEDLLKKFYQKALADVTRPWVKRAAESAKALQQFSAPRVPWHRERKSLSKPRTFLIVQPM